MRLDYGAPQRDAVTPILADFVARGYSRIPEWPRLVSLTRARILEHGCARGETVAAIAEAAALAAGMTPPR